MRTHSRIAGLLGVTAAILALAAPHATCAQDSLTWRQHSAAADSAERRGDWKAYRAHSMAMRELLHGHPGTLLALARGEAHLGDTVAALGWLRTYSEMGLVRDMARDSALAPLHAAAGWQAIVDRVARNAAPVSHSVRAFALPDSDFIAEDVAYDPRTHRFFVSSIRYGKIVTVDEHGAVRDFVPPGRDGVWSMMALAVDTNRRVLWATTSAMSAARNYVAVDSGRSAVLEYDLATGALIARHDAPRDGRQHVLGDMVLSARGDAFVSDAVTGAVYVVHAGGSALEALVAVGPLVSPQEPAITADGRLFVPDYVRGIAVVDVRTRAMTWLAHPPNLALNGIDGLTLSGHTLFAVQNGTEPNRVLRIELDDALTRAVRWETIESHHDTAPTHGVMVGGDFYFIANSGWSAFGDDGRIVKGVKLRAPEIWRVVR